ncbi:MAG: 4Fe-4S binding protein [Acholeplasmatales bacterium]|nr:4Fe-4S binding protein [Acholeplasmatales bacterium]
MAYKIDPSRCIKCLLCISNCPVGAITEESDACVIDETLCVSCGTCAAGCPCEAISEE